jgi:hypothetical protein
MDATVRGRRILLSAIIMAAGNFLGFGVFCAVIGGDALNGSVHGGRYYVSDHGAKTEVSREAWTLNYIHGISAFVTHGLVLVALVLLRVTGDVRRKGAGGPKEGKLAEAAADWEKPPSTE